MTLSTIYSYESVYDAGVVPYSTPDGTWHNAFGGVVTLSMEYSSLVRSIYLMLIRNPFAFYAPEGETIPYPVGYDHASEDVGILTVGLYNNLPYVGGASLLGSGSIPGNSVSYDSSFPQPTTGDWYEFRMTRDVILPPGASKLIFLLSSNQDKNQLGYTKHTVIRYLYDSPPWSSTPYYVRYAKWNGSWQYPVTTWAYNFRVYGMLLSPGQPYPIIDFPNERPADYDPDKIWTPDEDDAYADPTWQDPGYSNYQAAGGGRWGQQLVVAGKGLIYYEDRD